jgi:hypothetical protein
MESDLNFPMVSSRRDPSLQRNLNGDNLDSMVAVHTVLELYRVHDLTIVRLLPSADDEINTAVFHPFMVTPHFCSPAARFMCGGVSRRGFFTNVDTISKLAVLVSKLACLFGEY